MTPDQRGQLANNRLLRGLTEDQIGEVSRLLEPLGFPERELIVRESEPPDRVYLLASGRAQVWRRLSESEEVVIADLEENDFFGEMSVILRTRAHSASVRAVTPVSTFCLRKEDFVRLLSDFPEITRNILSNIILQLQDLNDRFLDAHRRRKQMLEEMVSRRTLELEAVNQRIRRELALAQNIQRHLLPERRKDFPGVSISTEYVPCDELGGDITGVFQIDETRIGVYGGDVCGHGVYAAMVMSYVKKLIETSFKRIFINRQYVVKPPGAVLTSINGSFMAEISQGDPEIYLTLFLGVLDISNLGFQYSSAGTHVPPLVVSRGLVSELFEKSDFPLGHVRDHEYQTTRTSFSRGDSFLFASDGVIEVARDGALYGMDRLKAEVLHALSERGELDLGDIIASLKRFLEGAQPQDDMCLLSISFSNPGPLDRQA